MIFIKFIIKWIDNRAVINEIHAAKMDGFIFVICSLEKNISNNDREREANIIGIDKSIENIAAVERSKPKNLAPVIVTPALLAPGINAKTWKIPMINACI